jgi:hypothetical protein
MNETNSTTPETEINIEEIMQQIRAEIRGRRIQQLVEQGVITDNKSRRLPPEFYEHLYHAEEAHQRAQGGLRLSQGGFPLIAPALQWLRRKFHELVLFYVNESAARQIEVQRHLIQAVTILSQELERLPDRAEFERLLQQEADANQGS